MDILVREATAGDQAATRALVLAAFADNEPEQTAVFLDRLRADSCVLGEWLAEEAGAIVGHVVMSRVRVEQIGRAAVDAVMLTPLAVHPSRQRRGYGTRLTRIALDALDRRGETLFFVLGHPQFYPRCGFSSELAADVESPWGGRPAFMARSTSRPSGHLVLPRAIAEAH